MHSSDRGREEALPTAYSNSSEGDAMLFSLHLWAAPVRNLVWVTAAFGYR
jgi:hypothetical protein